MINLLKKILIILILLFLNITTKAQDVQFSQLFADKLYLNPAYVGSEYCPRLMVAHRNQWAAVSFPYLTYSASYDQYIEKLSGGIGVRIMKDDQGGGVFSKLNADFIYAYKLNLTRNMSLKLAIEASIFQQSVNTSNLIFPDMIDPLHGVAFGTSEAINVQPILTPDFSSAFLLSYKNYSLGFNVSHLPIPIVAEHNEILPMKFIGQLSTTIPIMKNNDKLPTYVLEPNIVYVQQFNTSQLFYGMYFGVNKIAVGMFVRQNLKFDFDAFIASFHINIKQMSIGYSHDITLSRLYTHSLGTHELTFTYLFNCDKKIKGYKTISCPSF